MGTRQNDSNLGNMQIFSENFDYYLKRSGELKKEIAETIDVSASTICDWVKCRTYPRMDKIEKLAEHWGISMSDLVEKRSVENAYHREKYAQLILDEISNDPKAMELYQAIRKLSPKNKEIVKALVDSLPKEG